MNKPAFEHSLKFITSWLKFRYDRTKVPGYAVAVSHKGKLVLSQAYGFANLENSAKLTTQHLFRIASHSKTFTATALMQLAEKNKLRIDDYAADYLPWLGQHKDKRFQKITIRQLMSHGAGVIRDGLNSDYWQLERPFPDAKQLQSEILEAELVIDGNLKLKYSNFGYSLLGLIVEAVSGMPYNTYVTEHIVKKLGLQNTGPEYTAEIKDKLVTGYSRRDVNKTRLPISHVDTKAMASATGFYSTAEDLCVYFTAQMVGSKKLLSDESKKEMQRIQWHAADRGDGGHEDYGLGFDIEFVGKRRTIGHGGGFPGHITKSMFDPENELVVVVLTNCIDGPAAPMAKGIYGIIDYYQKNTPVAAPKHDLKKIEGRYINLWGITDIVVTGDKVVAANPDSWHTLTSPEELEYVNETTFKVKDTGSFGAEGEFVKFNFKSGKVETVNYTGATMWPEEVWLQKQQNRTVIG